VEVERRKVAKREKQRNCLEDSFNAQIVESWVIGRIAQNATSMELRNVIALVTTLTTY
jgi:hypothetical protein